MVTFYRRLPKFDYIRPDSIEEVLRRLADNVNGKYKIYAGGTDVVPKLKARETPKPEILIDLKGIPNLDYIDYDEKKGLRIGALATVRSVATSPIVSEKFPILSQAAGRIASTQVQNRGTIAGNICSAVPSADSAPALLCLEARVIGVKKDGERAIGIDAFFKGPNKTVLDPDELLKEIQIPPMPESSHGVYIKLSPRSRMDLAVVGVAAVLGVRDRIVRHIKIGLGAVSPTPMRAREAENMLWKKKIDDELITKSARRAMEESRPISDHRASAEYRKMMVEVLVDRAIHQALAGSSS